MFKRSRPCFHSLNRLRDNLCFTTITSMNITLSFFLSSPNNKKPLYAIPICLFSEFYITRSDSSDIPYVHAIFLTWFELYRRVIGNRKLQCEFLSFTSTNGLWNRKYCLLIDGFYSSSNSIKCKGFTSHTFLILSIHICHLRSYTVFFKSQCNNRNHFIQNSD